MLGRRQDVARTGVAFSSTHWDDWNYNDRNELTDSLRYLGVVDNTSNPQTALNRVYGYDPIGNRTSATTGTTPLYYCANELNQYTATKAAQGDTCPPANPAESFTYDDDGNLTGWSVTGGSTVAYTWDAENRLIRVSPASSPVAGDKKVEFRYDYLGRRVEKRVYAYNGSAWVDSDCRRFVYYKWLPLLELEVSDPGENETVVILRKYTWGLDLAGQNGSLNSINAAGGIGGLLACYDTAGTTCGVNPAADDKQYIYLYDVNGNVGQVIDWTNAAVNPPSTAWGASRLAATYEYDPYGNVTASAGAYVTANTFRFSTKYWDNETGLGYWGYRYYSPRLGRWISRDPIEENGGVLLYRYSTNNAAMQCDSLGLISNHMACCKYKHYKGYSYAGGDKGVGDTQAWTDFITESCPCTMKYPKSCCICSMNRVESGLGLSVWERRDLVDARWEPCCRCIIKITQRRNIFAWPHRFFSIVCPNGTYTLDLRPDHVPIFEDWIDADIHEDNVEKGWTVRSFGISVATRKN